MYSATRIQYIVRNVKNFEDQTYTNTHPGKYEINVVYFYVYIN